MPEPADLRRGLPLGSPNIDDETLDTFIEGWQHLITLRAGAEYVATPLGELIARLGGTAEAREISDAQSGLTESPVAVAMRKQAMDLLTSLDEATTGDPEQPDDEVFGADVDEDLIATMVEAPFWEAVNPTYLTPIERTRLVDN